jgi:hypothetical protein
MKYLLVNLSVLSDLVVRNSNTLHSDAMLKRVQHDEAPRRKMRKTAKN